MPKFTVKVDVDKDEVTYHVKDQLVDQIRYRDVENIEVVSVTNDDAGFVAKVRYGPEGKSIEQAVRHFVHEAACAELSVDEICYLDDSGVVSERKAGGGNKSGWTVEWTFEF